MATEDTAAAPVPTPPEDDTPEGLASESPGLEKAQQNYSNAAKEFLNKLDGLYLNSNLPVNRNMREPTQKLQRLAGGTQPIPNNDETLESMIILREELAHAQKNAGKAEDQILAEKKELDAIMDKAKAEQKNVTEATKIQNQRKSGDPTNLRQETVSMGIGLVSNFDVLIDDQNKSVQAQKTVFRRTAFDAVLKVAAGEKGVIGQFKNITLIPRIDDNMLARRYSATKNKYVKRRFESIMASLDKNLNPRTEITAIYSHLKSSQRAALKQAMTDYETKREEFVAKGGRLAPAVKPVVETSGKAATVADSLTVKRAEPDAAAATPTTTPRPGGGK